MKTGLYIGRVTMDGKSVVARRTRIAWTGAPDVTPGAYVRVCTLEHHAGPQHSLYLLQPDDVLDLDEIAAVLNVGMSYAAQLLIDRRIPSQPFARCLFSDVMAFKDNMHAERQEALAELVRLTEEYGGYDKEEGRKP